jgi:hypothetical protein
MPTDWRTMNLNDIVRVKLTPLGEKVWYDYWRPYAVFGRDPMQMVRDHTVDGWFEYHLWGIVSVFGPHMANGLSNPLETVIQVRHDV